MAQTKPKAAQFYGVSGNGTAGQVLISDGNGGMSWGANTENYTVSWATPTGQSLTYTQPNPQSSSGGPGSAFPTTTFTATKSGEEISGTATIAGLPTGITASQSLSGTGADNVLTVTLTGVFPGADSLNTALTISGLTVQVPLVPLTVEYLVVAGGGGGGASYGGGGGAGGYRTNYGGTALSLNVATNYNVTVGAGGASAAPAGADGGNSVFSTITSTGGGGGADGNYVQSGKNGGSGGGGGYTTNAGGSASPAGQGNNGGSGSPNVSSNAAAGGGGGGAGAVGVSSSDKNTGGDGGAGLSNSITGSAVFYAGGGGGGIGSNSTGSTGSGGSGGGGTGSTGNNAATAGTANTGGGGGGGGQGPGVSAGGAAGGSGIVILRYPSGYTISGLSGTTTTVGTDKVTTFTNAGTGNIQFN
jgi:hypothetical protein